MESRRNSNTNGNNTDDKSKGSWLCTYRVGLAIIGFWGCTLIGAMRFNLSMAIVCMVNHTSESSEGSSLLVASSSANSLCKSQISNSTNEDGEFKWDKETQGIYLGAFYWGYATTPILGGKLAERYGGKRVIGISFFSMSAVSFLIPFATRLWSWSLIVLRVLQGMGQGAFFPAFQRVWSSWAPPLERSKLIGFSYAGTIFGIVISLPIAGFLCSLNLDNGWPLIFYISGALGIIWSVLWFTLAYDDPDTHPRISDAERRYITSATRVSNISVFPNEDLRTPWKRILTSWPVWAGVVGMVSADWMVYTLGTNIPSFLHEVHKLKIEQNGLVSALPFLAFWMIINLSSYVADVMRTHRCSTSATRKIMLTIGNVVPAILLIGMLYVDCTLQTVAITLLVIATGISGCHYAGIVAYIGEPAPPFAGLMHGMANTAAALSGILAPYTIGVVTKDKTVSQWRIVFFISAAVCVGGTVFFILFADGEPQAWVKPYMSSTETVEDTDKQEDNAQKCKSAITVIEL